MQNGDVAKTYFHLAFRHKGGLISGHIFNLVSLSNNLQKSLFISFLLLNVAEVKPKKYQYQGSKFEHPFEDEATLKIPSNIKPP